MGRLFGKEELGENLCARCNLAMGRFEDDPILLRKVVDYLDPKFIGRSVACDG